MSKTIDLTYHIQLSGNVIDIYSDSGYKHKIETIGTPLDTTIEITSFEDGIDESD